MENNNSSITKPVCQVTASVEAGMAQMSEPELTDCINQVRMTWGAQTIQIDLAAGGSPYSPYNVLLFHASAPPKRGDLILITALGSSHNGSGQYKGRGRWRKVWLARPVSGEEALVVCHEHDPAAVQVGCLNFWVQTQEDWEKSQSVGKNAVKAAFEKLGL